MNFASEKLLVDNLLSLLQGCETPWGSVPFTCEFDYSRGRTDVVALHEDHQVIAFEAKLCDWKTALHQAYRNTCYADRSFVVLPKSTAMTALCYVAEFERRGVGLCYIDDNQFVVIHDAPVSTPIEPWLSSEARSRVRLA